MTKKAIKAYLFCPMCGTEYSKTTPNLHRHCSKCNYTYFENLRVATGAIIIQKNQLLMVKRAINPQKGFWDIPGGFSEPDEHPEACIIREVKEELGISSKIIKLFATL